MRAFQTLRREEADVAVCIAQQAEPQKHTGPNLEDFPEMPKPSRGRPRTGIKGPSIKTAPIARLLPRAPLTSWYIGPFPLDFNEPLRQCVVESRKHVVIERPVDEDQSSSHTTAENQSQPPASALVATRAEVRSQQQAPVQQLNKNTVNITPVPAPEGRGCYTGEKWTGLLRVKEETFALMRPPSVQLPPPQHDQGTSTPQAATKLGRSHKRARDDEGASQAGDAQEDAHHSGQGKWKSARPGPRASASAAPSASVKEEDMTDDAGARDDQSEASVLTYTSGRGGGRGGRGRRGSRGGAIRGRGISNGKGNSQTQKGRTHVQQPQSQGRGRGHARGTPRGGKSRGRGGRKAKNASNDEQETAQGTNAIMPVLTVHANGGTGTTE